MEIILSEKVDPERLERVKGCSNLLIKEKQKDKDIDMKIWVKKYYPVVKYFRNLPFGRWYGGGLQGCSREIR